MKTLRILSASVIAVMTMVGTSNASSQRHFIDPIGALIRQLEKPVHQVHHVSYHNNRKRHNFSVVQASYNIGSQCGIASWYSLPRQKTASGERMSPGAMTVAHKYLPMGTIIRITNRANGRSAIARINDRGPYVKGRIVDLTPAVARRIGMNGLANVCISKI